MKGRAEQEGRSGGGRTLILCLVALSCAALAPESFSEAQEEKPQQQPVRIEYGHAIFQQETGEFYLTDVHITGADFELKADRAILWSGVKDMRQPGEVYAEGNVRYRRGASSFLCDALYYNRGTGRALATNVAVRGKHAKREVNLAARAERIVGEGPGKLRAEGVSLSTCTYGEPHLDLWVNEATVEGEGPREPLHAFDLFPYETTKIRIPFVYPRLEGIPFLVVPGARVYMPGQQNFPIRSVRGGQSSRYGVFVLVDWGLNLSKGFADSLNPWSDADEQDDAKKWGEIRWDTDWREERGGAGGLGLKWEWDDYFGYAESYYLYDLGRGDESDFDRKFAPLEREERGRIRAFHRHDFAEGWRLEGEVSYLSDRDVLEEFFPQEFKEGKEQETVGYLRYLDGNFGAFALQRHRLNDFQDQLEYLPRIETRLVSQPILPEFADILTFSQQLQSSHVRMRFDEEDNVPGSERMWRFDANNELAAQIRTPVANLVPFGAVRSTLFEDDLTGHTELRHLWTAGGRATSFVHGVHDAEWDLIGLRRLRHIVQLDAEFTSNLRSTADNDDLFVYEPVDALDRFEEAAFIVEQRFQTKGEDGKTHEFLSLSAAVEYYPQPGRDTVAPEVTNFEPPFYWIPLAPGETGGYEPRHWSNIFWEADFRPRNIFWARARGEYNPEDDREEIREIRVGATPWPSFSVSAEQVMVRDVTNAVGGRVSWTAGGKWILSGSVQYDYERDEYIHRKVVLGRDFHDFILEANYERDEARDETRFYVTFVPKFLGKRERREEDW